MSTKWKYYNSKRGRGSGFSRGRGRNKSLASFSLPRADYEDIHKQYAVNPMNPEDYRDETLLCMSFSQGMLGAAFYEQSNEVVRIMNDISEDSEFEFIAKLIESVKPTTILVNASQDLDFINFLTKRFGLEETIIEQVAKDKECAPKWDPSIVATEDDEEETTVQNEEEDNEEEPERNESVRLIKLNNNFFKLPKALARLADLMNSNDVSVSREERDIIVKMRFDVESVNMIRSLGALLFYLDDSRLGVESQPLHIKSPIKSVKTFVLDNIVEMDFNTFQALDIIPRESEKRKGSNKKSSLFSIVNRCKSTVGRRCLEKWFRNPTTNRETLRSRQRCIHFFIQDCNMEITASFIKQLNRVKGLGHVFNRFQAGTAQILHWDTFVTSVGGICEIIEMLKYTPIKDELIEDNVSVTDVSELIIICKSIIDFDESRREGRVSVSAGVDEELDNYKLTYKSLPSVLTAIAEQEANRLGIQQIDSCTCYYVPLLGYLLSLPHDFPLNQHPDLAMVYKTDSEIRVKNEMTAKLEEEVGDILMQIIDKETAIVLRLKKMIMKKKRQIIEFLSLTAKVDALISLAMVASEMGWNCPSLVDEPIIEANALFHPIAALITKKDFVPNRVLSGTNGTKVSIITGPNACGKSVYMKQIGLLAFLAHIGSYVPARQAKVGPVDRIMTRIFTTDSVLDGMSTFAKDVDQVAVALRKATEKSLVIMDEFGKGTMTEVGLALLASCLTHWIEKGADKCPHLFVSSHFHALPKHIPIQNNIVVFLSFHVNRRAGGKIDYLFKLVEGIVDCSFAMAIANDEKVPMKVIERACQIYEQLRAGNPLCKIEAIMKNTDDSKMIEYIDKIASESDFMYEIDKMIMKNKENQHKEKSRRTLADDNLYGDTQGVDESPWDCTQNLIQDDESGHNETYNKTVSMNTDAAKDIENWVDKLIETTSVDTSSQRIGVKRKNLTNPNLSVSFALPKESSKRTENSLMSHMALFDKLLPPRKTAKVRDDDGYSSNAGTTLEVEETQKSSRNVTKLTPMMRRLSSKEEEQEKSRESLSSLSPMASSASRDASAIFTTPKLEEAKKRVNLDSLFAVKKSSKKIASSQIDEFFENTQQSTTTSVASRWKRQEVMTPNTIKSHQELADVDIFKTPVPEERSSRNNPPSRIMETPKKQAENLMDDNFKTPTTKRYSFAEQPSQMQSTPRKIAEKSFLNQMIESNPRSKNGIHTPSSTTSSVTRSLHNSREMSVHSRQSEFDFNFNDSQESGRKESIRSTQQETPEKSFLEQLLSTSNHRNSTPGSSRSSLNSQQTNMSLSQNPDFEFIREESQKSSRRNTQNYSQSQLFSQSPFKVPDLNFSQRFDTQNSQSTPFDTQRSRQTYDSQRFDIQNSPLFDIPKQQINDSQRYSFDIQNSSQMSLFNTQQHHGAGDTQRSFNTSQALSPSSVILTQLMDTPNYMRTPSPTTNNNDDDDESEFQFDPDEDDPIFGNSQSRKNAMGDNTSFDIKIEDDNDDYELEKSLRIDESGEGSSTSGRNRSSLF